MKRDGPVGLRTMLLAFYAYPLGFYTILGPVKKLRDLGLCLTHSTRVPRSSIYPRIEMNVQKLVDKWMEIIPAMCLAHDKDVADEYEARTDELLTPILAAPIRQCREFVAKLREAMIADQRVPYVVWAAFDVWQMNFAKAPDEGVKRLKKKLAGEIVDMVEEDVRPDLRKAMVRALMWRDPGALEEIKEATVELQKRGGKVRAIGRESCLFLQVPQGRGKKRKAIML